MIKVVEIRFSENGKIYFFNPLNFSLKSNDKVVVSTARGIELGFVVDSPKEVSENEIVSPLKEVLRVATKKDYEKYLANIDKGKEAIFTCEELALKCGLEMKIVGADFSLDSSKVIFSFTSSGRVDFRELVKELASIYKMRIELKQIGLRDEAKLIGGVGCCGRTLCCQNWLADFTPVSIKMAKNQDLALNPSKISGSCGRLMCCLSYENDNYIKSKKCLPRVGDKIDTSKGEAIVKEVRCLQEGMIVNLIEDFEEGRYILSGELEKISKEEFIEFNRNSIKKPKKKNNSKKNFNK